MGLGGGIEAGKAFVKFLLDDKEFKSKLGGVGKSLQKFGAIGLKVTAPIIAGFAGCVAAAVNMGGKFADMADRTGLGVELLSELAFTAQRGGVALESVEKAARKMTLNVVAAAQGTGTFGRTLSQLGINVNEFTKLNPDQQFIKLAHAIADIQDPTMRAAMANRAFGKSGQDLLPMLAQGSAAFDKTRQQAHLFGVTLTAEEVVAMDRLGDALTDGKEQLIHLAVAIGGAVAGPLADFFESNRELVGSIINWVKENKDLVVTVGKVAGVAATLTLGMYALGTAVTFYENAVKAAKAATIVFGFVMAIISKHPIIAALTAIGLLIVGIATYFGWASKGAKEFQKSLDAVKVPGGGNKVDPIAQQQADAVVAQLKAAQMQPASVPTAAAADRAAKTASDGMGEVVKWTRAGAETLVQILQTLRNSDGLIGGAE